MMETNIWLILNIYITDEENILLNFKMFATDL